MVALSGISERNFGKCLSTGADGTMMEQDRTWGRRNDYGHS